MTFNKFAKFVSDKIGSPTSFWAHFAIISLWVLSSIFFKVDPGIVILTGVLTIEGIFLLIFLLVDEKAQSKRVEEISKQDLNETKKLAKILKKE